MEKRSFFSLYFLMRVSRVAYVMSGSSEASIAIFSSVCGRCGTSYHQEAGPERDYLIIGKLSFSQHQKRWEVPSEA